MPQIPEQDSNLTCVFKAPDIIKLYALSLPKRSWKEADYGQWTDG